MFIVSFLEGSHFRTLADQGVCYKRLKSGQSASKPHHPEAGRINLRKSLSKHKPPRQPTLKQAQRHPSSDHWHSVRESTAVSDTWWLLGMRP